MTTIHLLLFVGLGLCQSSAFSQSLPKHVNPKFQSSRVQKLRIQAVTSDDLLPETCNKDSFLDFTSGAFDDPCYCLELDSGGRVRLCDRPDILLEGLNPAEWTASHPESGDLSSLFLYTSHLQERSESLTSLGELISCRRLLACSRQNRYWMGPKVGSSAEDIPFDTQFLLVEIEEDKQYALMLPLVDKGFRASLHHGTNGPSIEVVCAAESGDATVTSKGMRALYISVGDDPYELVKRGFKEVAEASGTFETLDNKKLPPSVDDFGWCTWDAFYSEVSPEGILEGIESFQKGGVPPRTLILDDGWQTVSPTAPVVQEKATTAISAVTDAIMSPFVSFIVSFYQNHVQRAPYGSPVNRLWTLLANHVIKGGLWSFFDSETDFIRQLDDFSPNRKFEDSENGGKTLKQLVTKLKVELGVRSVYCWHALHGYWRGVSEELGKKTGINVVKVNTKPSKSLMTLEPHSAWDPVTLFGVGIMSTPKDLEKFYDHIHTPLAEAGVDGVKVDVQSGVSAAGDGMGGGPHLSKLYMKAMEASAVKKFPSGNGATNVINCMCHSTENLYRHKLTSVARASEDFFPEKPESHTAHLVNVAYNSLFIGEICLPDWDMFHSLHESAELHAAARAIGGCPVYVSDKPGEHDFELLRKLVLPDGTILRAKNPGRPTRDCLFNDVTADGLTPLKIWNENNNGGVVGAFNVQGVAWNFKTHENEVLNDSPPDVVAKVKANDVESLRSHKGPFVGWQHGTSEIKFLSDGDALMEAKLAHRDWDIFTIVPVQISGKNMWAPIGLAEMMNSGGAVVSMGELERSLDGGCHVEIESRGPGRFVAFTNSRPSRVVIKRGGNDSELPFIHDGETGELSFLLPVEESEGVGHRITLEWK